MPMPVPPQPTKRGSSAGKVLLIVAGSLFVAVAALVGFALLLGAVLPDADPPTVAQPQTAVTAGSASSAAPSPTAGPGLTARAVVDRLAELYPLPNVRDNTGYARDAGVVEAITSDAVTVLRFASEAQAQKWVDGFFSAECRRAGTFVLSWSKSGPQDLASRDARDSMHRELQRLVGA